MSKLKVIIDELRDNDPSITMEVRSVYSVKIEKKKLINIDTIVQYSDYFETAKDVRKI